MNKKNIQIIAMAIVFVAGVAFFISGLAPDDPDLVGYWQGPAEVNTCVLAAQIQFNANGSYRVSSFADDGACEGGYAVFEDDGKQMMTLHAGGYEKTYEYAIENDVLKIKENGVALYHYRRTDGWRCEGAMCR